jgi:putative CocE/NonD family hydrolase
MRQPYGCRIASTVVYAHPAWYASQGYLVLVLDVRGRGGSAGDFQGFPQEAADGDDSLEWLRNDHRCNGKVGCYGFSYQGLTQLLGQRSDVAPDAIAPAMCGLDERLHWASEGGSHWWALGLGWGLQLAAESCRRRKDQHGWDAIRSSLLSGAFLSTGTALLRQHDPSNPVLRWLQQNPLSSSGWRSHEPEPSRLQRPMLLVQGWSDPYLRGGLDLWKRSQESGDTALLRIGPWNHLAWDRRVGAHDHGSKACGPVDQWQLAFFDQHLRGHDPFELVRCRVYDQLLQRWCERDPAGCSDLRLGLSSNGLAAARSDEGALTSTAGAGDIVWVHDPWRPAPGRGGHLGLDAGLVERADIDARADVACFTTEPLEHELELWGRPQLSLKVAADCPGFDLCIALSVLPHHSHQVLQLCTGVARQLGDHCLSQAPRIVHLQPLLATLRPGDRLRVSVAAAAWPQVSVNPGSGLHGPGASSMDHQVITLHTVLEGSALTMQPMAPPPWAEQQGKGA